MAMAAEKLDLSYVMSGETWDLGYIHPGLWWVYILTKIGGWMALELLQDGCHIAKWKWKINFVNYVLC